MRYADPKDVLRGRRAVALKDVPLNEIETALDEASAFADSMVSGQFKPPLKKWDVTFRRKVSDIAFYNLMLDRGFKPGGFEYEVVRQEYDDAMSYFGKIARHQITLPGSQDSSSNISEYQIAVEVRDESRGW